MSRYLVTGVADGSQDHLQEGPKVQKNVIYTVPCYTAIPVSPGRLACLCSQNGCMAGSVSYVGTARGWYGTVQNTEAYTASMTFAVFPGFYDNSDCFPGFYATLTVSSPVTILTVSIFWQFPGF